MLQTPVYSPLKFAEAQIASSTRSARQYRGAEPKNLNIYSVRIVERKCNTPGIVWSVRSAPCVIVVASSMCTPQGN